MVAPIGVTISALGVSLTMTGGLGLRREFTDSGAYYLVRPPSGPTDPTVLLVHGLGSSATAWQPVVRHAPAGAGLVIPDLPGFGNSPNGSSPPLEAAEEMVAELLNRSLAERRLIIVAHSVGGIVALRALERVNWQRVDRLVLVAGALLTASTVAASARAALALPSLTAMVAINVAAGVVPLGPRLASRIARRHVLRSALLWPFLAHPNSVGVTELLAALPHPGGRQSAQAIWSARDIDLAGLMEKTKVPSRIVHGCEDRLISQEDIAATRRLLASNDLIELKECGHWPHIERPTETAAAAFAS